MHTVSDAVQAVALETYGGLVTLTRPENCPEGASPRNHDMDFLVGSAQTRAPLQSVYSFAASAVGPNGGSVAANVAITGNAWANPGAVTAGDNFYAQCTPAAGGSDGLQVTAFAFDLPATASPTGITLAIQGYANSAVELQAQLLLAGVPVGTPKAIALPQSGGTVKLGGAADLWGQSIAAADVNAAGFGVLLTASSAFPLAQVFLDYVTLQVGLSTISANFNFLTTFAAQDGTAKNLLLDASGSLWVEDLTNAPGQLSLVLDGVTPNSFAKGINGSGVEFLAFNDLTAGCDVPRQYTAGWVDRISQVGPGAPPVFTASAQSAAAYTIASITQPAAQSRGYSYFLRSTGPGSNQPGNVITFYYADSTNSSADADLVNAFNAGNPVYVYVSFTTGGVNYGPHTVQVTSVGLGGPPGQPRQFYYFTFVDPEQANTYTLLAGSGHPGYVANYQRTLATMTMAAPVPQLTVGSTAVVTGSSIAEWNQSWPISQTPNSGSLSITQSSLAGGVATYSYAVNSGANPVPGQLITITNTLNANGTLNGTKLTIASVSGTNIGTFTVTGFAAATNYAAQAEQGQGVTAGTVFCFEPGLNTLGNVTTSPIYGNAVGGKITLSNTTDGQYISPGTKQGVCGFITRNGYWTAPSSTVTFTVPENTTEINYDLLPLGPPNVIGRYIALTESGQEGTPGGNFYTIPTPVQRVVEGVTYTDTALVIWDNTTTSGTLQFADATLLAAEAIDIQGNNLFNLIELGNPGWIVSYSFRNFYGLCQNKLQNFTNLSFDGGYLPAAAPVPLGWTIDPSAIGNVELLNSAVFGNSLYITNPTTAAVAAAGLITQGAYQDSYLVPIIQPNTAYSVRVTARCPSGKQGTLHVDLSTETNNTDVRFGAFTQTNLTTAFAVYTGTLLTSKLSTVPEDLLLRVWVENLPAGGDVEIDRIEVFPTDIPVLSTTVFGSYANDLESVDAVTGKVLCESENRQPVNGGVVMYDTLYLLKQASKYSLQSSDNLEPAQWGEPEVAQRVGACGINAYDFGEQWTVEACRNGLYLFDGGQPGKIMQEIFQVWDAINWNAGKSIWVKVDAQSRRIFVGVPLPTPNFWLPNAPANPAPTSPNVVLMCNYQGCDTGDALKSENQLHVTMFGSVNATDMKRKWSIWQIASPYAEIVSGSGNVAFTTAGQVNILDGEIRFGNGIGSSKVYRLNTDADPTAIPTDDGATLYSSYTTYGHVNQSKAAQMPLLGMFRKLWTYLTHQVAGAGLLNLTLYPNALLGPGADTTGYYPWSVPGGFQLTDPCIQIREAPVNFAATRTFVEFSTTGRMDLSGFTLLGRKHVHNQLTGRR